MTHQPVLDVPLGVLMGGPSVPDLGPVLFGAATGAAGSSVR
ncbi:hypothetical protein [Streptomyces sp. NBC_01276]